MSRIGKKPVIIPKDVELTLDGKRIAVKGPKGSLSLTIPEEIQANIVDGEISFVRTSDKPKVRALHGLTRALTQNMITGVTQGFVKRLEIRGTGYRAQVTDNTLVLSVGFSHPVRIEIPPYVEVKVEGTTTKEQLPTTIISVAGIDKEKVGHFAALIRKVRPPEPYKGKGIRYEDERVRKKAGKTG